MRYLIEDFKKAISRFENVLNLEKTDIVRDSAIKRFEICFDLAWKSIKAYAKEEGFECYSPRSCIKAAFQLNVIDYDETWLKMIGDRNLTAHIYREKYAQEVYSHLPGYLGLFKELIQKIENI